MIGSGLIIYLICNFGFNVLERLLIYNMCLFLFKVFNGNGGCLFSYNLWYKLFLIIGS